MASRVFLVDGDLSARRGLARLLRTAGHDVREFASASELLDSLHPETSGCLVLDAGTPGLSGGELVAELDALRIDLPVIVISADDEPEIRRQAYAFGAVGFFRKPVDGTALLDAIAWAKQMADYGAGEILLTSMDRDGTRAGFNLPLTKAISEPEKNPFRIRKMTISRISVSQSMVILRLLVA